MAAQRNANKKEATAGRCSVVLSKERRETSVVSSSNQDCPITPPACLERDAREGEGPSLIWWNDTTTGRLFAPARAEKRTTWLILLTITSTTNWLFNGQFLTRVNNR